MAEEESRLAIVVDSRGAERNVRNVRGELVGLEKQGIVTGQALKRASALIAAGGTAAAGTLALMTKQGLDFVDSQAKLSAQLGSTIDDLRAVQIAASDFGIAQGALEGSLRSFTKRLGDTVNGMGEAQKAYEKLGIEASRLAQMPLADQLALVSQRIAELDSAAERAAISDRLMSGGRRMVSLFEDGGDAIRTAVQEVDEFGLSLSRVDAAKVEQANDAIARIPRALEPIRTQLAITLAEPLTDIADGFNDAARQSNGFAAEVVEGVATATETTAKFVEQLNDVRLAYLRVRELELNFQAALEMGQNAVTPGEQATPAMDALEDVRQTISDIEEGSTGLQRMAEWGHDTARQMRENFEERQREREELAKTGESVRAMGESAQQVAQRFAGVMPTGDQSSVPGLATAPGGEPTAGQFAPWSSITPVSADEVPAGGVMPTSAPEPVPSLTGAGGGRHLGTLTLVSDKGKLDVFTENPEAATKWLADTLSGAAASVGGG